MIDDLLRDAERRQAPAKPAPPARRGGSRDWSMLLLEWGGWLTAAAFGGLFWLVNGWFSVLGLETISAGLGDGGVLFWGAVSFWQAPLGGLPDQPIIPWCGVVAATLLQVGLIWRTIQGRSVPAWAWALGGVLSIYDVMTTFQGLGTLTWVDAAGILFHVPLALFLTFGLEALIGYMLRKRR